MVLIVKQGVTEFSFLFQPEFDIQLYSKPYYEEIKCVFNIKVLVFKWESMLDSDALSVVKQAAEQIKFKL